MKKSGLLGALFACFLYTSPVNAISITYEFALPNWTFTSDNTLLGTDAIVRVTVDNGSTSQIDQNYQNSDIKQVSVITSGTYSNTWLDTDISINTNPSESYISTNSTGVPTLDLSLATGSRIVFSNTGETWQFARLPGFSPTYLETATGANAYRSFGFSLTGTTVVPIPPALWLFGSGLLGLIGIARRKKAA